MKPTSPLLQLDVELAVTQRYSAASQTAETALCCSVRYEPRYLEVLPAELIERDYGCGDPSRFVRPGETVLDLGSGGGKVCYIASQIVGPTGRVIGVDMNDEMLALARGHQAEIGRRIGWNNVEFRKGRIQDLALDLDVFEQLLNRQPVSTVAEWLAAQRQADELRQQSPMIASESIDVVLSNCVLNLVHPDARQQLFSEVFRVLRPGGRAVISDIVSSQTVPDHLRNDPQLWSGCISGAHEEEEFLAAFQAAGFHGLRVIDRQQAPWTTVEGIEFRSLTVQAFRPVAGAQSQNSGEVIYRGPWRSVVDDTGCELVRGRRTTVSGDPLRRLQSEPFRDDVILVDGARDAAGNSDVRNQVASAGSCCPPGKCC